MLLRHKLCCDATENCQSAGHKVDQCVQSGLKKVRGDSKKRAETLIHHRKQAAKQLHTTCGLSEHRHQVAGAYSKDNDPN